MAESKRLYFSLDEEVTSFFPNLIERERERTEVRPGHSEIFGDDPGSEKGPGKARWKADTKHRGSLRLA